MPTSPNDDLDGAHGRDATRELLEEAHTLAMQVERVLASPSCRMTESEAFRVRLARAHTLSLLDQLAELLAPRLDAAPRGSSRREDGEGSRARRDEGEGASSGVRPSTWMR